MKKLIVDIIIITERILTDFIFCLIFEITIHFGKNPRRGGIPAIDKISILNVNFIFWEVCWVKFLRLIFLNSIIVGIEIIM